MYEDDFSFEFDAEYDVEEMIAALKEAMPRNLMTVLNISKFKEVIAIVNVIVASIRRQCEDAKFTMNFDRGFGIDIMLDVVSDYIGIDTDAFAVLKNIKCDAISAISVTPRTDGNLGMTILFEDVKVLVPPTSD